MQRICSLAFIVLGACLAFPLTASAYAYPYYAQTESVREGSELLRFTAAAAFVHERLYPDRTDSEKYLCSVSKLLPRRRGAAFLALAAGRVAAISGMQERDVLIRLSSHPCPSTTVVYKPPPPRMKPLHVDPLGRVVSSNPVWNSCIRGSPLTVDALRRNPDTFLHRRGHVNVRLPLSCRDYHRGNLRVWHFPDDAAVELVLDHRGRLLGDAPPGYVLTED